MRFCAFLAQCIKEWKISEKNPARCKKGCRNFAAAPSVSKKPPIYVVIPNQSADWCGNPPDRSKSHWFRYLKCLKIRGIATAVCALPRNDMVFRQSEGGHWPPVFFSPVHQSAQTLPALPLRFLSFLEKSVFQRRTFAFPCLTLTATRAIIRHT